MKNYVLGFIWQHSEEGTKVLLLKKRPGTINAGLWNGVGGKLEDHESPLTAIIRETKEETGFKIGPIDWKYTHCLAFQITKVNLYIFSTELSSTYNIEDVSGSWEEPVQAFNLRETLEPGSIHLAPYVKEILEELLFETSLPRISSREGK